MSSQNYKSGIVTSQVSQSQKSLTVQQRESKYLKPLIAYKKKCEHSIDPLIEEISKTTIYSSKYPLVKIMKCIVRMFMLNQIELLYLAYVVDVTQWNLEVKVIQDAAKQLTSILTVELAKQEEYKQLQLYILLVCHTVKFYFNEEISLFTQQCQKYCPKFRSKFKKWIKSYKQFSIPLSLKQFNHLYIKLGQMAEQNKPNLNLIVDTIVQLSPPYNQKKNN